MSARPRSRRQRNPLGRLLRVWLLQHAQAFVFSLGQFFKAPVNNLLLVSVIGISLALPAAFYLILGNAQRVMDTWQGSVQVSLYLDPATGDAAARELAESLRAEPGVEAVRYISRDEALEEYRRLSGFDEALAALEENPLPPTVVLTPAIDSLSSEAGQALLERLNGLQEVDMARFDSQWIQRLVAILEIMQRGVVVLSALLAVAVLLVVGNSIRLAIHNRRTEIEVNKLFGATNAFVQRPFLYTGLIHGLAGGLVAWLLVGGALLLLDGPIDRLAALYHSDFQLYGLQWRELGLLLAGGGALGVAGSWLAVQRQLRDLDLF